MSSNIVSSIERIGLNVREWNTLAIKSPTRTIFQTHQWLSSWETTFKERGEPFYVTVKSQAGDDIEGVAPLMITRGGLGQRVVKFLGDGKADYCDVLFTEGRLDLLDRLFEQLLGAGDRWDCIELNSIPAESPTIVGIQNLCRKHGCRFLRRELYLSPTLLINGHESDAEKVFNKSSLRRRQNYFQRQGKLAFKTLCGCEVAPHLEDFFSQHIDRWSGTGTPSLFLDERNRAFYRKLAGALSDTDWLKLS
ncbi:MAG: GNAT family N-acetyltransferase, partial [Nitrospira sp.]|nr:GNAT family N-acetyltransferase [Nitrospira sp.]